MQLTFGPDDDTWPAWSPDGQHIAFVRGGTSVYLTPTAGGSPRRVAEGVGEGVSWSPDGAWLALANVPPPQGKGGLFLLRVETGERRELTLHDGANDQFPAFSPDGQQVAFMRRVPLREVFVVSAGGGRARQITTDSQSKLGGLTWTADSLEIVYSTQREFGGAGLWRVPVDGGQPRRIGGALQFAGNPRISMDGRRLAYSESRIVTNIYQAARGSGASAGPAPFGEARPLIVSTREDRSPSFSPDGTRIAFVSNRSGYSEVWVAHEDGSQQTPLTDLKRSAGSPRWSPDGRWIVFDLHLAGMPQVWMVPVGGGAPRPLTTGAGGDKLPAWSPDGQWIYFASSRSGSDEIWRMRPDGRDSTSITSRGGREPQPSDDGRTVYYRKRIGFAPIWMVPAEGGTERPVPGLERFARIGRSWQVAQDGIYFLLPESNGHRGTLRFYDFASREVRILIELTAPAPWTVPAIALSPDRDAMLIVKTEGRTDDLIMIDNFR